MPMMPPVPTLMLSDRLTSSQSPLTQRSSAPDGALQPAMPPRLPLPVTMICMVRPCATDFPLEA